VCVQLAEHGRTFQAVFEHAGKYLLNKDLFTETENLVEQLEDFKQFVEDDIERRGASFMALSSGKFTLLLERLNAMAPFSKSEDLDVHAQSEAISSYKKVFQAHWTGILSSYRKHEGKQRKWFWEE
jgi:hypothetical protein